MAPADAPAALRTARRTLELLDPNDQRPVIWCQDHLATLWLLAEDFLAGELAKRSLDPFDTLTDKQRDRLSDTLLAWLETRGGAPEIAKRLDVHPQTVRARMHQLEELFGDRLNDPDNRLGMQLALRSQRLVHKEGYSKAASGLEVRPETRPAEGLANGAAGRRLARGDCLS